MMDPASERSQRVVSRYQSLDVNGKTRSLAQIGSADRVDVVAAIGLAVRTIQALVSVGFSGEIPGVLRQR